MTAAGARPLPPTPPPAPVPTFTGRASEGRAVLLSIRAARSVAIVAPPAYGKSALLAELEAAVSQITVPLSVPKLAPFTSFLSDLHDAMHGAAIYAPGVGITKDLETDRASWKKKYNGGNEARARALVEGLRLYTQAGHQPPAVLVDDAGGVTQGMTPVLVGLAAHCALVLCVYPETLQKAGTRRLWQLCDRVELNHLDAAESRVLVGSLTTSYGIHTPDMKAYENSVLALSSGIPGEIVRLVRYVPAAEIVQQRGGSGLAQNRAAREERGTALAPLLLVLGAVFVIIRVLGRARGEMDAYVIGQVGMAATMILLPLMRRWTAAK
jgi:hypothetical protein